MCSTARRFLCTCEECVLTHPDGALIPKSTRQVHRQLQNDRDRGRAEAEILKRSLGQLINVTPATDQVDLTDGSSNNLTFATMAGKLDMIVDNRARVQQDLMNTIRALNQKIDCFTEPPFLLFVNTPLPYQDYQSQFTLETPLNDGLCALNPKDGGTWLLMQFESSFVLQLQGLVKFDCLGIVALEQAKSDCVKHAVSLLRRIDVVKQEQWDRQKATTTSHPPADISIIVDNRGTRLRKSSIITNVVLFLCATLHLLLGVPRRPCRYILLTMRLLLHRVFQMVDPTNIHDYRSIINDIPSDIRTVVTRLGIVPKLKPYVCCPRCCALYPCENDKKVSLKCTEKETSDSEPCGTWLQKEHTIRGIVYSFPIRMYYYQDLPAFLSNLLERHQMEDLLEHPLRKLQEPQPDILKDVWDGSELRSFLGSDDKPFLLHESNELRLVFALSFDNFTPYPEKTPRSTGSVGAIFLVCLNFPPGIRYNLENICLVGITPGPRAPSLTELNHFLRPLVDQLLTLWHEGFYYTSTPKFPAGRLVRGALTFIVADLHAIRQVGGFGSALSRHFCTFCGLLLQDIEDVDPSAWPPLRTCAEHRKYAEDWLKAPVQETREEIFERTGLRWSELLRLPYWDPTRFTLYDTMHGWYLNVAENYVNDILGLDAGQKVCGDGTSVSPRPKGSPPSSQELLNVLQAIDVENRNPTAPPKNVTALALYTLCEYRGLRRAGTRLQLWRALHGFYSENEDLLQLDILNRSTAIKSHKNRKTTDDAPVELSRALNRLAKATEVTSEEDVVYLERLSKENLLILCERNSLNMTKNNSKHQLAEELIQHALRNKGTEPRRGVVLGAPSLREINRDISRTVLPSWMASGPPVLGPRKRLSLKADEWRIVLLVRLAITLPRLWSSRGPRGKLMLDHFVNLVESIVIGGSGSILARTNDTSQVPTPDLYSQTYGKYLRGIIELYPTAKIHPNTHLAFHVGKLLSMFGPVFAWRCYVFEHFNGMIQDIPTNSRFGQLEQTFMKTFCTAVYLKGLIMDGGVDEWDRNSSDSTLLDDPGAKESTMGSLLQELLETGHDTAYPDKTTYKQSSLGSRERMDDETNQLLVDFMNTRRMLDGFRFGPSRERGDGIIPVEPFVTRLPEITHNRRLYRRVFPTKEEAEKKVAHQDSHILIKRSDTSSPIPYSIQDIYVHRYYYPPTDSFIQQVLLVVYRYQGLKQEDIQYDFWRPYPFVMGRLYYDELEPQPEFAYPEDIVSHFAKTPFTPQDIPKLDRPCVHVLPLNWDDPQLISV